MSTESYTDHPKLAPSYNYGEDSTTYTQQQGEQFHPQNRNVTTQPDTIKAVKYARVYETKKLGTYQSLVRSTGKFFGYLGMVPCCCCTNPFNDVEQGNVGIITSFGELSHVVDPGSSYVNIFSEKLYKVSIKTEVQEIAEQACLTKDNVIVYLRSVIYYNIIDPQKALFAISNIHDALSERTQTTLRDVVGARVLQDVIERREEIAEAIQQIITQTASDWGVNVESILIKDLRLSPEITQALSQAAQAKRIGESKIIQAKSEVEASRLMRESAKLLNSKVAVQMRYLDAMVNMAKTANSKVIFMPTSVDIDQSKETVDDFDESDALLQKGKVSSENTSTLPEDMMKRLALQEGFIGEDSASQHPHRF